eukprot:TRINITY_DN41492_c0_g1_i1.p1 TRINITY_DN41492_c0_g1~~TRINITY_DN41492_c0_g1_i1.p1  ORF type:complete len:531 (-),score=64.73 TRINITY_DN41492_c0_g1_i1:65-1657(-)
MIAALVVLLHAVPAHALNHASSEVAASRKHHASLTGALAPALRSTAEGATGSISSLQQASSRSDSFAAPTETEMQGNSGDWLFGVRTTSCEGDTFDNPAYSGFSRAFLPCLFFACVLAVLSTSYAPTQAAVTFGKEEASGVVQVQDEDGSREESQRLWHLDFARICAVMCVIFEHSGGLDYTHRNVGFGLWWALPYLYMTSGIGSMLSKSSMFGYVLRLVCVFLVGVLANWCADSATGRDWRHDFGNTIFQMFFVVMLIIMAPLCEPLRQALRAREALHRPSGSWTLYFALFWGFVTLVGLAFALRQREQDSEDYFAKTFEHGDVAVWIKYYAPLLKYSPIILVHVGGTLFLSLLATMVCHDWNTGMVGWILLSFTYLQMIVIPWDQDSFVHLICLNIFAMVTTVWPLQGSKGIAFWVQSYWPFLLMFLCLDSMPDMWGRCDVHSPYLLWERFRMQLGEFVLAVCFVSGAFSPKDPLKVTGWMGKWSLYAYCFHVMWYRLLGSPYGAVVTFAGIPVFWALSNMSRSTSKP